MAPRRRQLIGGAVLEAMRHWPREAVIAWVVSLLATFGLFVITAGSLIGDTTTSAERRLIMSPVTVLCAVAFIDVVSLKVFPWRGGGRREVILTATVVTSNLVLLVAGVSWSLLGFAVALILLRSRSLVTLVWLLVGAAGVWVTVVWQLRDGPSGEGVIYGGFFAGQALLCGLVLYALVRLCLVLLELDVTQRALARAEVERERERMSRDLHDVLGRTLVAVGLRAETALRLVDQDRERCRAQLEAARDAVQTGQAQLRILTEGPLTTDLFSELRAAEALLDHVGIVLRSAVSEVPSGLDGLAAAIVREAVTNILKHSRARWVHIDVREETDVVVLAVINDGHAPPGSRSTSSVSAKVRGESRSEDHDAGAATRPPGTGLLDLSDRVAAAGGLMTAGALPGGRFRVLVRLPSTPVVTTESTPRARRA